MHAARERRYQGGQLHGAALRSVPVMGLSCTHGRSSLGAVSTAGLRNWRLLAGRAPNLTRMELYFSDYFDVDPAALDAYGAFDISVVSDLPLFVDPFLLFNSADPGLQALHDAIIEYLCFLRDRSGGALDEGTMRSLYCFAEVKQNWLGFTRLGNGGAGLGPTFARALHAALGGILNNFGRETVTQGSHLEKVTLVGAGVGQDNISDLTVNLIKGWLCEYTQTFARQHLDPTLRREVAVTRAFFNYATETWATRAFDLPFKDDDFVLLTPSAILTRHETWISHSGMVRNIQYLPEAVSDAEQRAKVSAYLYRRLGDDPTAEQKAAAAQATIEAFPELIDLYVRRQEDNGDRARSISAERVADTRQVLVEMVRAASAGLEPTGFHDRPWRSFDECLARAKLFKHWIEDQDGYRVFNPRDGRRPSNEEELQLVFMLLWAQSEFDANREPNNGRGPVDFKISMGSGDKALIEFKLASNTQLKRNLERQLEIYERANRTRSSVTVIVCFTEAHQRKVAKVLEDLGLGSGPSLVVINARNDDKPSASKA